MASKNTLAEIKKNVEHLVGEKVRLKANKGRKKVSIKEGILETTYPNIFVVRIDGGYNSVRRVSYSYSDILTETVEITLCNNEKKVQVS
ncbi:Veg family protein [Geosporobacter ferrireducens]|uniref:Veg protein n=1 Tax=Geosporobacter ferrireducens TaxID=1424294 RepID=A0A1D8GH17_9FIRM|nr:Veg family protein [Geosporobacter ferrireducens]AOT70199.1 Veg protein [Geosporobacter ferrireducens]MTI53254.1 Veg protein [Geosporobacter ferrireducens]